MAAVSRAPEFGVLSAKAEGLGLGGIVMPVELGGAPPAPEPIVVESRYQALKTYSRHSPSQSSPPSLAPFASSLKIAPSSQPVAPQAAPAPTPVNVRKSMVQNISGDIISYPMVSRIDVAPTHNPSSVSTGAKTPAAGEVSSSVSVVGKKTPKIRPPPIKLPNSNHSSFLSPFKTKFGKEPSPDREKASKTKKSKAESRVEENKAAFAARYPDTVIKSAASAPAAEDEDDEDTLNITLPSKASTAPLAPTSLPPPVPSSLPLERSASRPERVPVPALGSPFGPPDPSSDSPNPNRPGHRRGTSDKSPQVVQNAFARVAMLEGVAPPRPVTMFSASTASAVPTNLAARRRSSASKGSFLDQEPPALFSQRRASRARSISSAAGLPKPDDAFFAPSVGGSAPSVASTAAGSRRPSAVPAANEGVTSVGISVEEGLASREVGRAAFSSEDGLTVSLRSYHRPDELEVGWVCIPNVDDGGRAYTTYEIRLRPRVPAGGTASKKSSTATVTRPRTPSASSTHFSNYRISDPPRLPAGGAVPPSDPSGLYPPGSPRTGAARRAASAQAQRDVPPPPRKYSARSEGSSFSSESSTTGPATPRRGGKLSIASLSSDIPPFDLDAVLASGTKPAFPFPQSATSSTFDPDDLPPFLPGNLPSSRRRMGRASSYAAVAEQYRARQFSIDEEGILNGRAASFSVGPGAVAMPPKSPKHHRFGCYIPPVTPNKQEFAELAKEAKRRSQGAAQSASGGGGMSEGEPPVPTVVRQRKASVAAGMGGIPPLPAGVAARGRKQSIAPPASLVIPPNPLTTAPNGERISPSSSGVSINSPLQPSPLRAAAAAVTTPGEEPPSLVTPTTLRFSSASANTTADLSRSGSNASTVISPPATAGKTSFPFPIPPHLASSTSSAAFTLQAGSPAASFASTTPPSPPPPHALPTQRGLLFPPDASPAPSSSATDSSFGNDLDRDYDPLAGDLALIISDVDNPLNGGGGDSDEEEEEDLDALEAKLVHARQAKRLASKWSDTEDDDETDEGDSESGSRGAGVDGEGEGGARRRRTVVEAAGTTSWSNVPDADESD
ncbi:hypothetical protein JCM6882_004769 [Rhodosporidiobolus microsporus]